MNEIRNRSQRFSYFNNDFDCFEETIVINQNHLGSEEDELIWICRAITKLMNGMIYYGDKEFVKNALIQLITLFKFTLEDT
jgi:hypothetical protein